jgi:hypothetical protein
MIEKLIQKSHGAGIGGVSSLVHKLVKLNPIKQTRNELKLGVVKLAQAFTTNLFIGAPKVRQSILFWRDKRTFGSFYFFFQFS